MTGLSQEDWQFLCEIATENGVEPSTFASMIIASELAEWRDHLHYLESEEVKANVAMNQEKQVEEAMA